MDVDKLADFGTIKTAHGDVEVAFCIFSSSKVRYHCIIRIPYNVLLYARLFLEYQCIARQIELHYLNFFRYRWIKFCNIQLDKFTVFIFNKIKPFNDTFRIPPLVYLEKFYQLLFIFSKIDLLIFPISLLHGFIKRQR